MADWDRSPDPEDFFEGLTGEQQAALFEAYGHCQEARRASREEEEVRGRLEEAGLAARDVMPLVKLRGLKQGRCQEGPVAMWRPSEFRGTG